QCLLKMQCRVASPLRVILVRNGRAEERHDPVAGVLIDGALEAVDSLRQDHEEAIHGVVPLFRIKLLGEIHRSLYVREQNGYLLPFALERASRCQDFLGEMLGSVRAGLTRRRFLRGLGQRLPAVTAEFNRRRVVEAARRTLDLERCAAIAAKLNAARVFEAAGRATHPTVPW